MTALVTFVGRLVGVSPVVVYLVAGIVAAGGVGVIAWRIHAAGYAAGSAAVQAQWEAAKVAERERQDEANREARRYQRDLADSLTKSEAETDSIVKDIANAPVVPNDPDGLGLDRVRALNRIR